MFGDGPAPYIIKTPPSFETDDDYLVEFCKVNEHLRIERTSTGELAIMHLPIPPINAGNVLLIRSVTEWCQRDLSGKTFAHLGTILRNGAMRSAVVSWIQLDRLKHLSEQQWHSFLPVCPDFVAELRSLSESLTYHMEKMAEYVSNGARLGWLLDPVQKQVITYRPGQSPEVLTNPRTLSGENVLIGFTLNIPDIWSALRFKDKK
jgi:Uma2 family endonuclease